MHLHLVDGTYELFRAYYAPGQRAQTPDGREVGAVRGILRTLLSLLSEPDCTHVAVAFDHVIESFRNDLFEGYKTGAGIEPELAAQFGPAEVAAKALGVAVWPMVEVEADDALASAAAQFSEQAERVVICTPDKDLAQCVRGERVVLRDRRRKIEIDEAGVIEKFGVPPSAIPDYLALVGDSADGIPGIPKWGAKSAATVLRTYGQLDQIPEDAADWTIKVRGAKSLAENLAARQGEAQLYRVLATLRTDVELPHTIEELEWTGAHKAELEAVLADVDYTRFMERVPRFAS
ncbi:MAG: 5'-3' exonuclease H3TH domain-containing protein [Myxococcota bacterium]